MAKRNVGERLRVIRVDLYGEPGGPHLAGLLGVPSRTWSNYEGGVSIPGEVLLDLLVLTGVEPRWLLRGEGARFRPRALDGARRPVAEESGLRRQAPTGTA